MADTATDWYRDAVIYELHVRAFCDSNGDGIGDFTGLTSKLDHLADLGVTALWLLPFYPSPLRDDGYDIADYRRINPAYGDMRSFRKFLRAAHDQDLKVITELVINHTSDQHPWFQRARHAPPGSPERDFYVWSDTPDRYLDARIIFSDFETSNWTWDPVAEAYYWHRFYSHQPDLNFENPAVEHAIFEVLDHWLDMGVDGLRLDAVPYLYEREGTNCENLPETHDLLKRLRRHVDDNHPARMLLAEANQWPEDAAAYFGDGDECHMNFHFPAMPRLFMGLQMENRTPIVDILEQTPEPPADSQWALFLRNHDELTLEMVTDEERDYMVRAYANDPQMRINLGIRRRLAPLLDNDRRKIELLNALLFSLPGTPVLYYGDEIGMGDNVYLGDRDGVRTPMQWSPDRNAGFSAANPHRLYLPLITEPGYHYENINVEAQTSTSSSLLRWMRQLVAQRRRHRVLSRGAIEFIEPDNGHVLAFVRSAEGEAPILVVANLSRLAQHVELDLRDHAGAVPVEVFGRTRFAPISELPHSITLGPYGFFWLELTTPTSADGEDGAVPVVGDEILRSIDARVLRPLTGALGRWMPSQRWFAGKGRSVRDLRIDDLVPLGGRSSEDLAMAIVSVSFTEGEDHRYAVPLTHVAGPGAASAELHRPGSILARTETGVILDAMVHQAAVARLVEVSTSRRVQSGRTGRVRGRPRPGALTRGIDAGSSVHLLDGEQSNTSAIVDGRIIAKLVRRIEPGLNPDVEVPTMLRDRGFARVPAVAATLDWERSGSDATTVMLAHELVPNEGDLWTWISDELARILDEPEHLDRATASHLGEREDPGEMSLGILGLLGRRTAELHDTLASDPTEPPEPFTLLYQRSLLQSLRSDWRETRRRLSRGQRELTGDAADDVAWLLGHGDGVLDPVAALQSQKLPAGRIRIHGDLHLGQVLLAERDVVFIDFEGEPARPLGERRIKRSALVDLAGLLRSVDYVARVALHTANERGRIAASQEAMVASWLDGWAAEAQRRLVEAYRETLHSDTLVPVDEADFELLLDAAVLDKALYEIRYEIANRPDWVRWPIAALRRRLENPR
ncbi:MAG: maltose alpha-D-glucosyltransferase [Acidimicrobiales bacterium]